MAATCGQFPANFRFSGALANVFVRRLNTTNTDFVNPWSLVFTKTRYLNIFNRPGKVWAVLQTPSSLIDDSLTHSSSVKLSSTSLPSQTEILRKGSPPPTCQVSGVTCHMTCVTCNVSHLISLSFFTKQ